MHSWWISSNKVCQACRVVVRELKKYIPERHALHWVHSSLRVQQPGYSEVTTQSSDSGLAASSQARPDLIISRLRYTHVYTHTRLTALFPGLPGWAGTRKVKPIWILLEQETASGSGISWAICKSAPRHASTGRMLFLLPNQPRQSTEGKHPLNKLANYMYLSLPMIAWLSRGFTSHSTQKGHFGDVSPSQSLGLVWKIN